MTRATFAAGAAAAAVMLLTAPAFAADHFNLEPGLPLTVEDAYPIAYRSREVQGVFQYDRASGDDLYAFEPRLDLGLLPNLQASLSLPYRLGSAEAADSGDATLEGLYNLNSEGLYLPAFALAASASAPFADDDGHWETEIKGIVTRSLGGYLPRRLHLNLSWLHDFTGNDEERENRYRVVLGYSQPVSSDTVLIADISHERRLAEGQEQNLAEAGVRYQLTPLAVLSAGGGVGLGQDDPDLRVTFGLQYALTRLEPF